MVKLAPLLSNERPRDAAVVALPEIDRAAVFEQAPVSGSARRRSRSAVRLGLGSELEASADVHHRRASCVDRADDLLDIDPL
jgi:hypothetical protein